jgi:hypothetical protein
MSPPAKIVTPKDRRIRLHKEAETKRKIRSELIAKLGGRCEICGEQDPIVLDFDHIDGNGTKHRTQHRNRSIYLIKKYLNLYQLLCKNCNWRKEYWRRQHAKYQRKTAQPDGSSRP